MLFFASNNAFSNVTLNTTFSITPQISKVSPRGNSVVPVYYFSLESDVPSNSVNDIVNSITFQSSGSSNFGAGIDQVALYLDPNKDGTLSDAEKSDNTNLIYSTSFSGGAQGYVTLNIYESLNSITSKNYFFTVGIAPTADYGHNKLKIIFNNILMSTGSWGGVAPSVITSKDISISTILLDTVPIFNNFYFPGETAKQLIAFTLQAKEDVLNDNLSIEVSNAGKNFDVSGRKDGVVKAGIWYDKNSDGLLDDLDEEIASSSISSFPANNKITFSNISGTQIKLNLDQLKHFLFTIDVGDNTAVGITQSFIISAIKATNTSELVLPVMDFTSSNLKYRAGHFHYALSPRYLRTFFGCFRPLSAAIRSALISSPPGNSMTGAIQPILRFSSGTIIWS